MTFFVKLTYLLFLFVIVINVINGQNKADYLIQNDNEIDKLISEMTLDEKIGQMTQVDIDALENFNDITKYYIGSMLAGGSSDPEDNSPESWANLYDSLQSYALKTRLKIPIIFGIDAVHGHNNVTGTVIFPHNIGMGCTNNPELIKKAARITAEEMAATGIDWTFAPCVAVARDERWGRTYESFGEIPEIVNKYTAPSVEGFQGKNLSDKTSVLACAKHYIGDGGTTLGDDQGNTEMDEETLRKLFLQPYKEAIEAGVGSIMVSYSSWNGKKMHGHKYLLTDVLKNELDFKGFLVSDWAAIDQPEGDYKSDVEKSINAGLDMIMIPRGLGRDNNYLEFITYLKELANENKVPLSRIDDAVKRILRVKFAMDIFQNPYSDRSLMPKVGSKEHREVGRECVRQSLVLLKNDNSFLPLSKDIKRILVAGRSADNLGCQSGGWTIEWEGDCGNELTEGTTIFQAVKNTVSGETEVIYSKSGSGTSHADAAIVVVGETPYAEGGGDTDNLSLSPQDISSIRKIKNKGIPIVVVLISGRPMILNSVIDSADAFIAAWLPGTEGQGVADVLFGDYNPTGKLTFSWPRTMDQIPINYGDDNYDPLFPLGFGLSY